MENSAQNLFIYYMPTIFTMCVTLIEQLMRNMYEIRIVLCVVCFDGKALSLFVGRRIRRWVSVCRCSHFVKMSPVGRSVVRRSSLRRVMAGGWMDGGGGRGV